MSDVDVQLYAFFGDFYPAHHDPTTPVRFEWDSADPLAVRMSFPGISSVVWTFGVDLLRAEYDGGTVGSGDVQVSQVSGNLATQMPPLHKVRITGPHPETLMETSFTFWALSEDMQVFLTAVDHRSVHAADVSAELTSWLDKL